MKNPEIVGRVRELQRRGAQRAAVTVESVVDELEVARQAALACEQVSAAVAASATKAKVTGLLDKRNNDRPVTIEECQTSDEVIELMIEELGGEHEVLAEIERMREALIERLAIRAKLITHSSTG